jgi:hypothetical protein
MAQSSERAVSDATQGPRNRPRASHACQRCRARKAKCDQSQPCSNCVRYSSACVFTPGNRGGGRRNTNARNQTSSQGPEQRTRQPDHSPLSLGTNNSLPQNASRPSVSALSERDSVANRSSSPHDHASGQSGNADHNSIKSPTVLNYISRLHQANDSGQRL